jgi:hypothetical protein
MLGTGHSTGLKQAAASAALLVTITTAGWAFGQPQGGGHPPGPPPEAFKACEGKGVGETVQIRTPRGEIITAICRLVAVPQR